MTCRYCGVETGSGAGHRSQAECIQALCEEIDRAKRLISSQQDGPSNRREGQRQPTGEQPAASR